MKKAKIWIIMGLASVITFSAVFWFTNRSSRALRDDEKNPLKVSWQTLQLLDVKTGEIPEKLKKIEGIHVQIPGYLVPLEDNSQRVSEFLLVPYAGACIHVPPPPPNQMVHIKMKNGDVAFTWEPVWAKGKLHVSESNSPYGKVSYSMEGLSVEIFQ